MVTAGNTYYRRMIRKDPCVYCGKIGGSTLDHIQPRCFGGLNRWWNFAPACRNCNGAKGHASVLEFMLSDKQKRSKKTRKLKLRGRTLVKKKRQIAAFDMPDRWFDPLNLLTQKDGPHAGLRL